MNDIQKKMLEEIADLHGVPEGAYNIRADGRSVASRSTDEIEICPKPRGSGLDIRIKPGTVNKSLHIPVVIAESGLEETVYNDFYIGDGCDVLIVAGCGIDNCGGKDSRHDGIHRFHVGAGCKVKYVEKHYGSGSGSGRRILNPVTEITLGVGSSMELDMAQIKGVDSTDRQTSAALAAGARLTVRERLMTHGSQSAVSRYDVSLDGEGSHADVISRSVARDSSFQQFDARLQGNAACSGHSECDSIIMDGARISAIPRLDANNVDAALIHEAAIGKIAGEQIIKLMTLGLTEREAEEQIINGFLS